jgi:hypothetical protein
MVHGSWFIVHGSWFMVHGSSFVVHGSWFMVRGSWFVVHSLWFMVLSSWFMVYYGRMQYYDFMIFWEGLLADAVTQNARTKILYQKHDALKFVISYKFSWIHHL